MKLNRHYRSHKKNQTYNPCDDCPKRFPDKRDALLHCDPSQGIRYHGPLLKCCSCVNWDKCSGEMSYLAKQSPATTKAA